MSAPPVLSPPPPVFPTKRPMEQTAHCSRLPPQKCHRRLRAIWLSASTTASCISVLLSMDSSTPGLPVHHQLPEFTRTHVHRVGDAIQPFHPLSSPSPAAPWQLSKRDPCAHTQSALGICSTVPCLSVCLSVEVSGGENGAGGE